MTITPQDIQSKQFHVRLRGFDVDEVDKFLEKIAEEVLVLSLEHKQAFERITAMEKEIANYRNKEQAFQTAILSAQRISDEMQERSRRESEETLRKAREEASALEQMSRQGSEETLAKAAREAEAIKELAESKSREMVANLGNKIVAQTTEVNRLIALKESINSDLRQLLEGYLKYLDAGTPPGLKGLTPLPQPEPDMAPAPPSPRDLPVLPPLTGLLATSPREIREDPRTEASGSAKDADTQDTLYERIEIREEMLEPQPMARLAPDTSDEEELATLEMSDIEGLDLEDIQYPDEIAIPTEPERRQAADISIAGMGKDILFTLEDPLDDLEPSISIQGRDRIRR